MTDLEHILPLWRELEVSGEDYVLATVVAVDGPSYRKPGARMLLAPDGGRAGTVSGCEKAWTSAQLAIAVNLPHIVQAHSIGAVIITGVRLRHRRQ